MKKGIFVIWFLGTVYACDLDDNKRKVPLAIELSEVKSAAIKKLNQEADSEPILEKELSPSSISFFVQAWNKSHSAGVCKYIPIYNLELLLKNGKKRHFRINGCAVKEKNDVCFDTDIPAFGEILWNNNNE